MTDLETCAVVQLTIILCTVTILGTGGLILLIVLAWEGRKDACSHFIHVMFRHRKLELTKNAWEKHYDAEEFTHSSGAFLVASPQDSLLLLAVPWSYLERHPKCGHAALPITLHMVVWF